MDNSNTTVEDQPVRKGPPKVTISALNESSFASAGRRDFLEYRDLWPGGDGSDDLRVTVMHVTSEPEGITTGWHYHECTFLAFYVLRGWLDIEFEEIGSVRLEAGSFVNIPPGARHNELRMSSDFESMEMTIPARIGTVSCPAPVG